MKKFFKSFAESSTKTQLFTILMTLFFLFYCACNADAEVKRDGNNFTQVSTKTSKGEDKATNYTYTDSKGTKYTVYLSAKGKAYIIRKSSKTGKEYKQYMPEIGKQINPEAYKEK